MILYNFNYVDTHLFDEEQLEKKLSGFLEYQQDLEKWKSGYKLKLVEITERNNDLVHACEIHGEYDD